MPPTAGRRILTIVYVSLAWASLLAYKHKQTSENPKGEVRKIHHRRPSESVQLHSRKTEELSGSSVPNTMLAKRPRAS
jgi:hypothetical protein